MDHQKKVFLNYQQKNYEVCLNLINEGPESIRVSSHYKVLKAACFVNLNLNFDKAHQILDEVLSDELDNAFAHYAKGIAFFHQKEMSKAISCFDKAIKCDESDSMGMARAMKTKAEKKMEEENLSADKETGGEKYTKRNNSSNKTCKICSKTFSKTFSLSRHMQLHTGERQHKCNQCNFAFIQRSDLTRHITTHDISFAFECNVCRKQFKTKKYLDCHQVIHKKHNAYNPIGTCDLCGKTFAAKGYIIEHMKTHSNFKPFGCNLCNSHYSTLAYLGMHFREFHGVGKPKV